MRVATIAAAAALVMVASSAALAAEKTGKAPEVPPLKVPEGYILLQERDWVLQESEPSRSFHSAREAFLRFDSAAAARLVRTGSRVLRREALRTSGELRKRLDTSARELEKLASDLDNSAVDSARRLDRSFARAHDTLALHHQRKAADAWGRQEPLQTGRELRMAAHHLQAAAAWMGLELDAPALASVRRARSVGKKLVDEAAATEAEVSKAIQSLGDEAKKLDAKLPG